MIKKRDLTGYITKEMDFIDRMIEKYTKPEKLDFGMDSYFKKQKEILCEILKRIKK